jgi:SAM-dependent methyltransferase
VVTVVNVPGSAPAYDRSRVSMPVALAEALTELAATAAPRVVDLGAGTGLSCRMWRRRAARVTAVEPDAEYRAVLERRFAEELAAGTFEAVDAFAERTGLPDGCADIVTSCGSFHWLDLNPTLAEVHRILRPGGVFAVCNSSATPVIEDAAVGRALREVKARIVRLNAVHGSGRAPTGRMASAEGVQQLLWETGLFRVVRLIEVRAREEGDGQRALELAGTVGCFRLLKAGVSEEELGLPALREAVAEAGGPMFLGVDDRGEGGSAMIGGHAVVTGVAGFIGSHLAETLLAEGQHVIGVDRRDPAHDPAVADQLAPCLGDGRLHLRPRRSGRHAARSRDRGRGHGLPSRRGTGGAAVVGRGRSRTTR